MTAPTKITARREVGRERPKGYTDWRPIRRTQVLLEQVEAVLVEYEDHLPLTVRQIFYRLVGAFDYEKTDLAYNRLAETLVMARRSRRIPFDAIRDDGVVVRADRWFNGPADFWDHVGRQVRGYERDKQAGQVHYVELWCESAGMMPQLAAVAEQFSVPVYSCGGFGSLSAIRHIVDRVCSRGRPTVLLHVGDYDPSGESIFDAMTRDVIEFLSEDSMLPGIHRLIPERVALQEEQVHAYGLPTSPPKTSDRRSKSWSGGTAQLEALPPDALAEIVHDAIEGWMNYDLLVRHREAEQVERIDLSRALPKGDA